MGQVIVQGQAMTSHTIGSRLRLVGWSTLAASGTFVVIVLVLATGQMFRERESASPILMACFAIMVVGLLIAAFHLIRSDTPARQKMLWLALFAVLGPFAAGWYLSRVGS